MARFPIIAYEQLTDANTKQLYDQTSTESGFGMTPNLLKSMAATPDFLTTRWHHFLSIILQGTLPRMFRAMIGTFASQASNNPYALNVHPHGLSTTGIGETKVFEHIATAELFAGANHYTNAINLEIDII